MFTKYQHIERIGSDEVEGLLIGECFVFPKIDGTNASIWWDDGIHAGSRNRELSLEEDNAGFLAWLLNGQEESTNLVLLCQEYPDSIFYGEYLIPHSLKTYRKETWKHFYIFDMYVDGIYVPYNTYSPVLDARGVFYIPLLEQVTNPTEEHLQRIVERNSYLIQDGKGPGEGIVIKRYDYVNPYGRVTWGKIVRNEFKEQNLKVMGAPETEMHPVEEKIIQMFVTEGRVDKIKAKMRDTGPIASKRIPELLERVWYDLITEETWNILKEFKNATIDFKKLHQFCVQQTKSLSPELFGG